MADAPPLAVRWDGEGFTPLGRSKAEADARFVIGERYRLVEEQERSAKQHAFFFVCLNEAWQTLTDEQLERWPSVESLRKWCLIKSGFCDQRQIVCSSKAEAQRVAAFVKPMDPMALVSVKDQVVSVFTAHSQSVRAMGKKEFMRSCDCVMQAVAEIIGCRPEDLGKSA